jgi:hypothetical protein
MTGPPLTVTCSLPCPRRGRTGRDELPAGRAGPGLPAPPGRVPRVARLLALALRCEQLLGAGVVASYRELAELGHVSRARVSQVMNLLALAPDLQEQILCGPRVERGRDPVHLRQLQPIAATLDWRQQRQMWHQLQASAGGGRALPANGALPDA